MFCYYLTMSESFEFVFILFETVHAALFPTFMCFIIIILFVGIVPVFLAICLSCPFSHLIYFIFISYFI